jgi:hypothetical protein
MGAPPPPTAAAKRSLGNAAGLRDRREYRKCWRALVREYGPPHPKSVVRLAMMRVCARWVAVVAAERMAAEARAKREEGKGRRPSRSLIIQLSKRAGLEDGSYAEALTQLRTLVGKNGHATPDQLLDRVHDAMKAERHGD